jgi:serine/threonine protein kinase
MALLRMPQSAKDLFTPIKQTRHGKHSVVVLAILKDTLDTDLTRRALKIHNPDRTPRITTALIEDLRSIQNDMNHPLVKSFEYDPDLTWYAMSHARGHSVAHLLANYYLTGLPPYLVFHVLRKIAAAQQHLQDRELCHLDLQDGSNIMLYTPRLNAVPLMTLVDYAGINTYTEARDREILQQFIGLARSMMRGEKRVPAHFRRRRSGNAFNASELAEADEFYNLIAEWRYNGKQTVKSLWDGPEQWGLRLSAMVSELLDESLVEELTGWLSSSKVSDEEMKTIVARGGMAVV